MASSIESNLFESIIAHDVERVKQALVQGASVHHIDDEHGHALSVWGDALFDWWQAVDQAYHSIPFTEQQKQQQLEPHQRIFDLLLEYGANVYLWDCDLFYGPLWDAASAACVPMVQRLLDLGVNPNTLDDEDYPILSSICYLWFEHDFEQLSTSASLRLEQQHTLSLLRQHGAKTATELQLEC